MNTQASDDRDDGDALAAKPVDEALVRAAIRASWDAYAHLLGPEEVGGGGASESSHLGAASRILVRPSCDHILFNRARAEQPEVVALAAAIFRHHRVPRFLVSVPRPRQAPALRIGRAAGLVRFRRPWVLMACRIDERHHDRLDGEAPAHVRVEPLGPADADVAGRLLCEGFAMPDTAAQIWSTGATDERPDFVYLGAWCEDELVGVGALYVHAEAAYLAGGVVVASHRRRGIQRALVRARVALARRLGASVLVSETGMPMGNEPNPSFDNLRGVGLRVVEVTEHLCPPGTQW